MNFLRNGAGLAIFLVFSFAVLIAAAVAVFGGFLPDRAPRETGVDPYGDAQFRLERVQVSDMDGWREDAQDAALPVFLRSCDRLDGRDADTPMNPLEALGDQISAETVAGRVGDWRAVCDEARDITTFSYADENARRSRIRMFFQNAFVAYRVLAHRELKAEGPARRKGAKIEQEGRFTAYFEPVYPARGFRSDEFSAPVYARPDDLVMVDLGAFRENLAGTRIAGAVRDGRLIPYADHAEINRGALIEKGKTLAWMRPTDLLFMQIQGSGKISLPNGTVTRLGYDGQNGHEYTAIGAPLIREGHIPREEMSMQAIRAWLDAASPDEAQRIRETNASYVFFRELTDLPDDSLGPLGASSVQLTAGRSLAVDRRYHALGAPVWVSIDGDEAPGARAVRRLFIAQDTGGAIRGPIRGDIYLGSGEAAAQAAGGFNAMGEMIVLLPKPLAARIDNAIS